MRGRSLLVGLIVVATAAFVTGVVIERNSDDNHTDEPGQAASSTSEENEAAHSEEGGDGEETHAEVSGGEEAHSEGGSEGEGESDATVLGIDLESTPLVVLAALASLGLALGVWLRPAWVPLLVVIAVAMAAFAVLDVAEVSHQIDENNDGLAILAGAVAALHLTAAAVAAIMGRQATHQSA